MGLGFRQNQKKKWVVFSTKCNRSKKKECTECRLDLEKPFVGKHPVLLKKLNHLYFEIQDGKLGEMVVCTDENGQRITCPCDDEDPGGDDDDTNEVDTHACELFKLSHVSEEHVLASSINKTLSASPSRRSNEKKNS